VRNILFQAVVLLLTWTCLLPVVQTSSRLHAQNDSIQASRRRLEEIRAERDRL